MRIEIFESVDLKVPQRVPGRYWEHLLISTTGTQTYVT